MDIWWTFGDVAIVDGVAVDSMGSGDFTEVREFREGIFKTLNGLIGTSLGRAIIYTIGHIIIAMTCNRLITGADWRLAGLDAIIEPLINGVWYYALDKLWSRNVKA